MSCRAGLCTDNEPSLKGCLLAFVLVKKSSLIFLIVNFELAFFKGDFQFFLPSAACDKKSLVNSFHHSHEWFLLLLHEGVFINFGTIVYL